MAPTGSLQWARGDVPVCKSVRSTGGRIAALVLLSVYPSVAMLAGNLGQVYADVVLRPLLWTAILVGLLYVAAWLLYRDGHRAALLTAWVSFVFFTYGHVYELAREQPSLADLLGRHRYLSPLWLVLLVLGIWTLSRVRNPGRAIPSLVTVLAVALAGPVISILMQAVPSVGQGSPADPPLPGGSAAATDRPGAASEPPDIYYIILDGYGRSDILLDEMGYDNRGFLEALEQLGFAVARCSMANYGISHLSMASSLNLDYLEALHPLPDPDSGDQPWVPELIQRSWIRQYLESRGYATVAFQTGYRFTELRDADLYIGLTDSGSSKGVEAGFEEMFLRSTWLRLYFDTLGRQRDGEASGLSSPQEWHRANVLYTLAALERLPTVRGPKFVFAHVLAPHVPYVFGAQGEPVAQPDAGVPPSGEWERRAYAAQAEYIGMRIVEIARILIEQSDPPPVIVIQGDHGPDLETPVATDEARMGILNAYYFSGARELVYGTITPVNTFRLVLNDVFDAHLPLAADRSEYSTKGDPFMFRRVANSCRE